MRVGHKLEDLPEIAKTFEAGLLAFHHHYLHEHQWSIQGDPNQQLAFHKPNNKAIRAGPPPDR